MTGFDLVGRLGDDGCVAFSCDVASDDVLAVAPSADGPLRDAFYGPVRVRNVIGRHYHTWDRGILAACGDYIFVARALGEHAFRPCTPAPAP